MKYLIELLAFLGALRNYSYIDRLGNAIDEVTVEEAVRDAIRAYLTHCVDSNVKCIEISEGVGVSCPQISPDDLEKSVETLLKEIKKGKSELLKVSRAIALEAYAAVPKIREAYKCTP